MTGKDRECINCENFFERCEKPVGMRDYSENNHKCINFKENKEKENNDKSN